MVWQGCQSLQQTLNQTELRLSEVRDSLLGEVRITAPVGMAGQPLALALSPLLQAHPGLCIRIIADDEKRNLIKERIDVALRVGSCRTPPWWPASWARPGCCSALPPPTWRARGRRAPPPIWRLTTGSVATCWGVACCSLTSEGASTG